ncbi:MAG: polymerase, partial [Comamonadaceae bacterium]
YGPFQLATLGALLLLWPGSFRAAQLHLGAMAAAASLGACGYAWCVYDTVSQAYKAPEQRRPGMRADPVAAAGRPLLFRDQLAFAELSVTPLTRANAEHVLLLANAMLHYSPEPMVIEKLLDSAILLGRHDDVERIAARYKAAFADRYDAWLARAGSRPASPG